MSLSCRDIKGLDSVWCISILVYKHLVYKRLVYKHLVYKHLV